MFFENQVQGCMGDGGVGEDLDREEGNKFFGCDDLCLGFARTEPRGVIGGRTLIT